MPARRFIHPVYSCDHFIDSRYPEYGMGRLPSLDFRDRDYLIQHNFSHAITARLNRCWQAPPPAVQSGSAHSVGYAVEAFLNCATSNFDYYAPNEWYQMAQAADEWFGNGRDGTSVRGGFKAMQKFGHIKHYQWAHCYEDIAHQLMAVGPMVMGCNWYESMFIPDFDGYLNINPDTAIVGGHAFLVIGVNDNFINPDKSVGRLRIQNSWGDNWGYSGRAWLSSATADRLLSEYGEACTSLELRFNDQEGEIDGSKEAEMQTAKRQKVVAIDRAAA